MTLDAAELKQLVKDALMEFFVERREDLREFLAEMFEDAAMIKAIHEGENTALVGKEDIFRGITT